MDYAFDFDNVKAEKASAMRRYNFFRTFTKLFRFTELFAALILLSWVFTRIPFAVEVSGHYFRRVSGMMVSPLFVFLLCNVIIATLFAKSGLFGGDTSPVLDNAAETELYQEILKNSGDRTKTTPSQPAAESTATQEAVSAVSQDKEMVPEPNAAPREGKDERQMDMCTRSDMEKSKVYRRTQSEKGMMKLKLQPEEKAEATRKLRRSETEKYLEKGSSGEDLDEDIYPHDKLSSEEFQRTVEEFIAERLRFIRQESFAIVVQNQS